MFKATGLVVANKPTTMYFKYEIEPFTPQRHDQYGMTVKDMECDKLQKYIE